MISISRSILPGIILPVLFFIIGLFVFTCSLLYNKAPVLRLMLLYGLCALSAVIILVINNMDDHNMIRTTSNVFLLLEFVLFMQIIRKNVHYEAGSRALQFFQQMFPLVICLLWLYKDAFSHIDNYIYSSRCILLCVGCLIFYYQLFSDPPDQLIHDYPPFWIMTGILVTNSLSVPFSFDIFQADRYATYSPICILLPCTYIILFLFLFNALKCQWKLK